MPASANWPERTLIIPILTVPCACADETPMTSARAQPSLRCVRCISILPGVVRLYWQNCTHENLRGRESSARRWWAWPHRRHRPCTRLRGRTPDRTEQTSWVAAGVDVWVAQDDQNH